MNLSPLWREVLDGAGHDTIHWSEVGRANASDLEILGWARQQGRAVLTHDLDFSNLLAHEGARAPSVIQLRGNDVMPVAIAKAVVQALTLHEADLSAGAIVTIDLVRARVRLLPLPSVSRGDDH
jgi:predicted nuclease of predicted toxin-antitoxin system